MLQILKETVLLFSIFGHQVGMQCFTLGGIKFRSNYNEMFISIFKHQEKFDSLFFLEIILNRTHRGVTIYASKL